MILTDVHMPTMDNTAATRVIRGFPAPAGRVSIVGLSASVMKDEIDVSFEVGMDDFRTKPIDPAALVRVLSRVGAAR
jgi:two-component system, sensor histidine kinase